MVPFTVWCGCATRVPGSSAVRNEQRKTPACEPGSFDLSGYTAESDRASVIVVIAVVIVSVMVPLVVAVPVAIVTPLVPVGIIPSVNFVVATVPLARQSGLGILCLSAVPPMLTGFMPVVLLCPFDA